MQAVGEGVGDGASRPHRGSKKMSMSNIEAIILLWQATKRAFDLIALHLTTLSSIGYQLLLLVQGMGCSQGAFQRAE